MSVWLSVEDDLTNRRTDIVLLYSVGTDPGKVYRYIEIAKKKPTPSSDEKIFFGKHLILT